MIVCQCFSKLLHILHVPDVALMEESPMINPFRVINPTYDSNLSQCSLAFDKANEAPMQSSISHENQADISQNSQPKKQDHATIGKPRHRPKIFLGNLLILVLMSAGIGILASQIIQTEGNNIF